MLRSLITFFLVAVSSPNNPSSIVEGVKGRPQEFEHTKGHMSTSRRHFLHADGTIVALPFLESLGFARNHKHPQNREIRTNLP